MCLPWVKLYTDIIHDRKMWKLTDLEQLVFFKLIALAGFESKNGLLPPIEDIALELRISEKKLKPALNKLIEFEMLEEKENGYFLKNFEKRQKNNSVSFENNNEIISEPLSNKERQKRFREKNKSNNNETVTESNESVTNRNEDSNATVTETVTNRNETVTKRVTERNEKRNGDRNGSVTESNAINNIYIDIDRDKEGDKDKEIEKEKDKDKDKEINNAQKTRGQKAAKKKYGSCENVLLSDEEYQKLIEKFGEQSTNEQIENLSLYMSSKGKSYKSHYATILNWDRMKSERTGTVQPSPKTAVIDSKFKDPYTGRYKLSPEGELTFGYGLQSSDVDKIRAFINSQGIDFFEKDYKVDFYGTKTYVGELWYLANGEQRYEPYGSRENCEIT